MPSARSRRFVAACCRSFSASTRQDRDPCWAPTLRPWRRLMRKASQSTARQDRPFHSMATVSWIASAGTPRNPSSRRSAKTSAIASRKLARVPRRSCLRLDRQQGGRGPKALPASDRRSSRARSFWMAWKRRIKRRSRRTRRVAGSRGAKCQRKKKPRFCRGWRQVATTCRYEQIPLRGRIYFLKSLV